MAVSEDSHMWICSATRFVPEAGTVGEKGSEGGGGGGRRREGLTSKIGGPLPAFPQTLTAELASSKPTLDAPQAQPPKVSSTGRLPPHLP